MKRAIRIGELLTEVKAEVAHGEWIPWVEENLVFGQREAQRYMRVAANATRVSHFDSLREAVSLLAEPKEEEHADESDVQTSAAPSSPDPAGLESVRDKTASLADLQSARQEYAHGDKIPSSGNLQDAYRDSAQIESLTGQDRCVRMGKEE